MNRIKTVFFHGQGVPLPRWLNVGLLLVILLAAGLSACGGKGDTTASNENGELSIALTDAEGDFVSYTVDVVSLSLTRANGTVVETLPLKTRVDFARYTDMTEFLTIATVPAGVYVRGTLVLDYSHAEILVEDAAGNPVAVSGADIRDQAGNVVSQMSMSVGLDGKNRLKITHGVPNHLALDFDLKASNSVNFAAGAPVLTVAPYLLAHVNADLLKPYRARGPLKDVQPDAGKFQVYVRPFTQSIDRTHRHFGVLNIHTSDETVFEIDGQAYQGAAGLEILAGMPSYSAVAARGEVRHQPRRRFDARQVYAGSSVPGGSLDVTRGSVVARNGDVLTVKGITFLRHNGAITFNDTVEVSLADSTTVLKALKVGEFSKDDISVGQYVTVFGTVGSNGSERTLDAANGYARLEISHLKAIRTAVTSPYEFTLAVSRINGRDVAQYDFAGTGVVKDNDALAGNYEVDNGQLDVTAIPAQAPVRVRGHVTPFGSAPADFKAVTIIDLSAKNK